MKKLLKIIFFIKPTNFHPLFAKIPKPGKETSKDYDNDWESIGWSIDDFERACKELGELLTIRDTCTHKMNHNVTFKSSNHMI